MFVHCSGTAVERDSGCPRGWTQYDYRCLRYISTPMTWTRAKRNCALLGGNLASVQNDWENYQIQMLTYNNGCTQAWIGGSRGTWIWSDGSPFRYNKWCQGRPDNDRFQHCLYNYSGGQCYDGTRCHHHLPSICARQMY
uniref:C-type lectin domain-containing protein n=1 Tax=Amphilophus citrinellus TaxID=61819 RepID=A0A3Q0RJT6_AMPCI